MNRLKYCCRTRRIGLSLALAGHALAGCGDDRASDPGATSASGSGGPGEVETGPDTGEPGTGAGDETGDVEGSSGTTGASTTGTSTGDLGETTGSESSSGSGGDVPPAGASWWRHLGGRDQDSARGVAFDSHGNVLVVGDFRVGSDLGGGVEAALGTSDVFVSKFAPDGAHLWSSHFGPGLAYGVDIAVNDADEVAIVGHYKGAGLQFGGDTLPAADKPDVFVAKLAADGTPLWSHAFGGDSFDRAGDVAFDGAGNVALAVGLWPGLLLAKLSPAGDPLFVVETGSVNDNLADWPAVRELVVDATGDMFVIGTFSGTAELGGGPLESVGGGDVFLAKYDGEHGGHLWSRSFGGPYSVIAESDDGNGVAIDPTGDVVLVGSFRGSVDFGGGGLQSRGPEAWDDIFLVKLDGTDGGHLWSRHFGGDSRDRGWALDIDDAGAVVVVAEVGEGADLGDGALAGAGVYISTYTGDGAFEESLPLALASGWSGPFAYGFAVDDAGHAAFALDFHGATGIGGEPIEGLGWSDVLLAYVSL